MGFIKRNIKTAIKLPFSVAWDCISLGNMGAGTSTGKTIREHQSQKYLDDVCDEIKQLRDAGLM